MAYTAHIQKMKGGHRVVVVSQDNNKLVLAGETVKRKADALKVQASLCGAHGMYLGDELPQGYRFTPNSGPKKRKP